MTKVKENLGNKDLYKYYKETYNNPVSYSEYSKIIKDCNSIIADKILDAEYFKMPYRLGLLRIKKFEQNLHKLPKNKWPVDYKESKRLGYIVYHIHDYSFRFYWNKSRAIIKWKSVYTFKACRHISRVLAHNIKVLKKDYFT